MQPGIVRLRRSRYISVNADEDNFFRTNQLSQLPHGLTRPPSSRFFGTALPTAGAAEIFIGRRCVSKLHARQDRIQNDGGRNFILTVHRRHGVKALGEIIERLQHQVFVFVGMGTSAMVAALSIMARVTLPFSSAMAPKPAGKQCGGNA